METLLAGGTEQSFDQAQLVYTDGGNSKTVATLTVPGGLPINVAAGTKLTAKGIDQRDVVGEADAAANLGANSIQFKYPVTDLGDDHLDCRQGGLPTNERVDDGCKYLRLACQSTGRRIRRLGGSISLILLAD